MADDSSSDDEPISKRMKTLAEPVAVPKVKTENASEPANAANAAAVFTAAAAESSDSEDDVPLAKLTNNQAPPAAAAPAPKVKPEKGAPPTNGGAAAKPTSSPLIVKKREREDAPPPMKARNLTGGGDQLLTDDEDEGQGAAVRAWWDEDEEEDEDSKVQWRALEHNGVIFPPNYEPHGKPLLYGPEKTAFAMTPEVEEVATFYAAMIQTEHAKDPVFQANFFRDFTTVLNSAIKPGDPQHPIREFAQCDFSEIAAWVEADRERKKAIPNDEKKRLKAIKDEHDKPFKFCRVDGHKEKVGNMMVEPPGLFRGRGEHPKKGTHKKRVTAEQIKLNLGYDAKVPICPMPGHEWGEILHNNEVSWLAYWEENVLNSTKYVRLANESSIKGKSDLRKYETARKLKGVIGDVRTWYTKKLRSKNIQDMQMAVAVFLIDRLALRVGGEKNQEEEADTVGTCSLRVEHLSLEEPDKLTLDFLGKDSIRNHQTLALAELFGEIGAKVFAKLPKLMQGKEPTHNIFDQLSPSLVNKQLHEFMPKLTAKVFRTYNASIVLDQELWKMPDGLDLEQKKVFYTEANTRVAILCNHQRTVAADHGSKMEKLEEKKKTDEQALEFMKKALPKAKKQKDKATEVKEWTKQPDKKKPKEGQPKPVPVYKWEKKRRTVDQIKKKIVSLSERIKKQEADMAMKNSSSEVSLSTSKINYMDPRVTIAWCKRYEVPIDNRAIFPKALLEKFAWAMSAESTYRF